MNDLKLFNYEEKPVRTVTINGEPWWVAKDVCDILGYSNHSDALTRHCKGVVKRYPLQTPGGVQDTRIINEPDLYRLIVGSNLPEAEKFEAWVFATVLPSIRKTGQYSIPKSDDEIILIGYQKLMDKVKVLTPKAEAYEHFLASDGVKDMAVAAQELFGDRMGRNTFMKKLRECGIFKPNNTPYQQYMEYFKVIPTPKPIGNKIIYFDVSYVKPAGMDYLAKKFNVIKEEVKI